jgi:hypothetical protein
VLQTLGQAVQRLDANVVKLIQLESGRGGAFRSPLPRVDGGGRPLTARVPLAFLIVVSALGAAYLFAHYYWHRTGLLPTPPPDDAMAWR